MHTNTNAEYCLETDSVQTIEVATKTKKVESCTNLTVYKIVLVALQYQATTFGGE